MQNIKTSIFAIPALAGIVGSIRSYPDPNGLLVAFQLTNGYATIGFAKTPLVTLLLMQLPDGSYKFCNVHLHPTGAEVAAFDLAIIDRVAAGIIADLSLFYP
ncbi:hypothetical protein ACUTJJ_05205 [Agrobacterium sp. DKPNP3]|uniref:hypothetical protein n=1 Tax=Agrobacterium sp. DKPNP3 TaxID=3457323 RepID=UPI004043D6E9